MRLSSNLSLNLQLYTQLLWQSSGHRPIWKRNLILLVQRPAQKRRCEIRTGKEVSRAIINSVGIKTDSRENTVNIDKRYHQVIHTTAYHAAVSIMLTSSYIRGKTTGSEGKTVTSTLRTIKRLIQDHSPKRGVLCRATR